MMIFGLAATLMLLIALAAVVLPLLRRHSVRDEQSALNAQIHRQRLRELEADRAEGRLSPEQFDEARGELERQLLEDVAAGGATLEGPPARGLAAAVGLLVPVLAVGLYFQFGAYDQISPPTSPGEAATPEAQLDFIRRNVASLQAKVRQTPQDLEAWRMLASSYMVLQRYEDAATAYARAHAVAGEHPQLLAEWAEALAYQNGGEFGAASRQLLDRALALAPEHPKALWLAGLAATQAEDTAQARAHWRKLLSVLPADSGAARRVQGLLAAVDAPQAPAGEARLTVEVRLDPALAAQVAPEATVFVLARAAEGPRAPLAVTRARVKDLPLKVVLDESMAMVPEMNLARFPEVVVEARISRSGSADAAEFVGRSEPVKVGREAPVSVVIGSGAR